MSEKSILEKIIREALNLKECNITYLKRIGGMTNKNYKLKFDDTYITLRLPGSGADKLIKRADEIKNIQLIAYKDIDVEILYINEETGIKITKYIDDAETLTTSSAKEKENMKLVAMLIRKLHYSGIKMENKFDVFEEIKKYENIINENNYKFYKGYKEIRDKVFLLEDMMKICSPIFVPSHNDTLPDNFIKDKFGKMYLIDWEYSGTNYELWDVAAYSLESGLSKDEEEQFLYYYFEESYKEKSKELLIIKVLQDIVWALWTIIKENQGDHYGEYGISRYNRGLMNLKKIYEVNDTIIFMPL